MSTPGIETFDIALPHGVTLSCRAAGSGAPRVLFLHGFPEAAFAWDEMLQRLAPAGRGVAPNLRGFERSSCPREVEAYRPRSSRRWAARWTCSWRTTGAGRWRGTWQPCSRS
jgi:pimeloyl-ACP methyl ester carboxylesterase